MYLSLYLLAEGVCIYVVNIPAPLMKALLPLSMYWFGLEGSFTATLFIPPASLPLPTHVIHTRLRSIYALCDVACGLQYCDG